MKLQNLAVIFAIIILPISIILGVYIGNQVETLRLQISYDNKLNNATYDALKAFQLNTINNPSSDTVNSKIRDIEASANSFFNSVASNFNMAGYNRNILKEYVPALVYTMYDGYYIYSSYINTIGEEDYVSEQEASEGIEASTYQNGETLTGLKSYVYYSCRYKRGSDDDFVITYSLDNYITIKGIIGGNAVNDAGYLISSAINGDIEPGNNIYYRGDIPIQDETLIENLMDDDGNVKKYTYNKINGIKYYYDEANDKWFSFFGGKRVDEEEHKFKIKSDAGKRYFYNAKVFTDKVLNEYGLSNLKSVDAVWEDGRKVNDEGKTIAEENDWGNNSIFSNSSSPIEEPNSNFNQHRREVIKYSIEKNLSNAISNYNNYTGSSNDFRMPKLKETDWDKLVNHISIISFLQGLNIGGKIYNGYSLITNTKNEEVVSEDSIYMLDNEDISGVPTYHKITENNLNNHDIEQFRGIWNIDLERKAKKLSNGTYNYYYPIYAMGSYSSVINQYDTGDGENIYHYLFNTINGHVDEMARKLVSKYFTALGRERYSAYKVENDYEKLKEEQDQP